MTTDVMAVPAGLAGRISRGACRIRWCADRRIREGRSVGSAGEEVHRAVLTEDKKRAAHRALQDRVLNGEGTASPEQRARAFSNVGLSEPDYRPMGPDCTLSPRRRLITLRQ
jgi:hypothetical protein